MERSVQGWLLLFSMEREVRRGSPMESSLLSFSFVLPIFAFSSIATASPHPRLPALSPPAACCPFSPGAPISVQHIHGRHTGSSQARLIKEATFHHKQIDPDWR